MKEGKLNELALFAGTGGGILGGHMLGWRTVCAVEFDGYAAQRLLQRQNERHLPPFPVWDDVCSFDGRPWRGIVDVVSGGFPCQDISPQGGRAGLDGAKSSLWSEMSRIIGEVRPNFALVENSAMLTLRGLGRVLGDLAAMGYDARWGVFSACTVGASHARERLFLVANSSLSAGPGQSVEATKRLSVAGSYIEESPWRDKQGFTIKPLLERGNHGLADRVDRLRCIGNGQVPAVVVQAWCTLQNDFTPVERFIERTNALASP